MELSHGTCQDSLRCATVWQRWGSAVETWWSESSSTAFDLVIFCTILMGAVSNAQMSSSACITSHSLEIRCWTYVSMGLFACMYMSVKSQGKQEGVSDPLTADHMSLWALEHPKPYTFINPRKAWRAGELTSKAESALSRAKIMASQISLRSTVRLRNRSSNLHKPLNKY